MLLLSSHIQALILTAFATLLRLHRLRLGKGGAFLPGPATLVVLQLPAEPVVLRLVRGLVMHPDDT